MKSRILGLLLLSLALVARGVSRVVSTAGTPRWSPWLLAVGTNGLIMTLMALGATRATRCRGRCCTPSSACFSCVRPASSWRSGFRPMKGRADRCCSAFRCAPPSCCTAWGCCPFRAPLRVRLHLPRLHPARRRPAARARRGRRHARGARARMTLARRPCCCRARSAVSPRPRSSPLPSCYFLVVAAIAIWAARRTRNASDFFVAGAGVGLWTLAIAKMAATLSGFTFIGGPGLVYTIGLGARVHHPARRAHQRARRVGAREAHAAARRSARHCSRCPTPSARGTGRRRRRGSRGRRCSSPSSATSRRTCSRSGCVIDAIFGTGLRRRDLDRHGR